MKKTLAIVLALVMILSLATTAFAASITIDDGKIVSAEYAAYKLLIATDGGDGKFAYTVNEKYEAILAEVLNIDTEVEGYDSSAIITAISSKEVENNAAATEAAMAAFAADVYNAIIAYNADDKNTDKINFDAVADNNEFKNVDQGYYLIVETEIGFVDTNNDGEKDANASDDVISLLMLDTMGEENITVNTKEDVPEVDKDIVEEDGYASGVKDGEADLVKTNEASIGDTVPYQIVGTVSSKVESFNEYYYLFTDTLSAGLTFNADVKVTIGTVDVTEYFTVTTADYADTDETDPYYGGKVIKISIADLLSLESYTDLDTETDGDQTVDITKDTKVVVTYTATLNEKAKIYVDSNPNKVDLTYSRDPYFESDGNTNPVPTGVTPEAEVKTYTTQVKINKVIGGTSTPLPGAEFTITGDNVKIVIVTKEVFTAYTANDTVDTNNQYWLLNDGTYTTTDPNTEGINTSVYADTTTSYYKKTVTEVKNTATGVEATSVVDKSGYAAFTGLGVGTYTIEETKVPAGYNKAPNTTVVITFDLATEKFSYKWNDKDAGADNQIKIENNSGSELPSTGGIGTTLFYVFGAVLVAGTGVLLITKKRMNAEA